jgi:outer membrane receptor for ferrienterochelin and colicins
MQGLDAGYTQVLTNGQPTMSSLSSVYGIEQIPAALVERIEIVKGGASTLYGSGAVAGVVNIIPREPKENGGYLKQGFQKFDRGPLSRMTSGAIDLVSDD